MGSLISSLATKAGCSVFPFFCSSVSLSDKILYIVALMAPFGVLAALNTDKILGVVVAIVVGFLLGFLSFWQHCHEQSRKPAHKKMALYSIPITALMLAYAIIFAISPLLEKTPVTKVVAILFRSVLGALVIGILSIITVMSTRRNASYCEK